MADVPEYDGYLGVQDDQIRESFIQLNENIRALEKEINENKQLISTMQVSINILEVTKSDSTHSH